MKNLGLGIRITWYLLSVFLISGFLGFGQTVQANEFLNWDALLKKYVAFKTIEGIPLYAVNYQALGNDPLYRTVMPIWRRHQWRASTHRKRSWLFGSMPTTSWPSKWCWIIIREKASKMSGDYFLRFGNSMWERLAGRHEHSMKLNMIFYGKWENPGFTWRSFAPR